MQVLPHSDMWECLAPFLSWVHWRRRCVVVSSSNKLRKVACSLYSSLFYIARSTPSYSHSLFFAIWFWAAIPLLEVIRYVIQSFDTTSQTITRFLTTVHEDNQGALRLAQMEPGRHTPRSKFYAIKHHWFRSWLKPNEIELQYIESAQQKADILTKSLSTATFEINRKLSCGW
jgi:Zn-dependent protease with chaperone function